MSSRAACGAITVAEDKMHEASKMRNAGTTKEMTSYIRCFLQHARYKAGAALAMMVLLGLLEGSGLLLLLPLLSLLGLGEGHPNNLAASAIPALLRFRGMPFTLPIVLGLFVLFMSGNCGFVAGSMSSSPKLKTVLSSSFALKYSKIHVARRNVIISIASIFIAKVYMKEPGRV